MVNPSISPPMGSSAVTLTVETSDCLCEVCHCTGSTVTDELDSAGVWCKTAPCESCNGTGLVRCWVCAAPATRLARTGHHARACCDEKPCALAVVDQLMRLQL